MGKTTTALSTPAQITRVYYIISGLYTLSASLIWGVNTLFLLKAGLNIFQVFIVNAIFSAGMTVFEFPTGVLADTRGRRISFLLSTLILAGGTLGYVLGAQMPGKLLALSVASIVMGLGYTFYSGAVEAWLVDALNASGYQGSLDRVFARSSLISGAAMLAGTVSGGVLGDQNLAIPYLLRAAMLILLFGLAFFTMHDIGFQPKTISFQEIPREMQSIARLSLQLGWKKPGVRFLMLMSFVQTGFSFWGFYAWPPYFLALYGREAVWISGVVAALIALATMGGNSLVEWLARFCGKRTTLMLWPAGISTLAIIAVGLVHSFFPAVLLLLISMVAQGVITPVQQAFMHQMIPSKQRAAIVSFNSMIGNGGGILGQTGLGYLSQVNSIAAGYVAGGIATGLVLPLLFLLRRLGEPADLVVGESGKQSPCAAQGIPSISHVDTMPSNES
jgi:MFS family permease